MNISRRKFMKAGIMVAAFAGIPLTAQITTVQNPVSKSSNAKAGVKPSSPKRPISKCEPDLVGYYSKSTFAPYVGSEFRVHLDGSKVRRIKLVEVREIVGGGNAEQSFSLLFTGPKGKTFPQKTYAVEHGALGKFSLFLVPVGLRAGAGAEYFEAVFNRS
jgi:hypothetical protein